MTRMTTLGFAVFALAASTAPLAARAAQLQTIYTFRGGSDGADPQVGLLSVSNTLYGTTTAGGDPDSACGAGGCGTVFEINLKNNAETVLHRFDARPDGMFPYASLLMLGTTLYGTTESGGDSSTGYGTVFKVAPSTASERLVSSFNGTHGSGPVGGMAANGNLIYGATQVGGTGCKNGGCGTVFAVNIATNAQSVLHNFAGGTDGQQPAAGLVYSGGMLYGTTITGGGKGPCQFGAGCGTVYAVNATTGAEKILHRFTGGSDGGSPSSELVFYQNALYGVTSQGGDTACTGGCGVAFKINPATGAETVLHIFTGVADGAFPMGVAMQNGILYGTTFGGGNLGCNAGVGGAEAGCGTLYSLNTATLAESVLFNFGNGTEGGHPASLVLVGNALYGVTESGGNALCSGDVGCGTVFKFTP